MNHKFRTRLYYFLQFWSGGAFHSYGGIWFASLGFTATQIGLANTIPTFIVLLTNILVGKLADRAKDWRQVLVILGVISAVFATGLIFVTNFYAVFFFWSASLIAQSYAAPVGDAAATHLQRSGWGGIGQFRALSTVGYIVSLFATGYVMQGFGGGAFAFLFALFCVFRAAGAFALPAFKVAVETKAEPRLTKGLSQFLRPWLLFPLLGWSIVYATLHVLNSFLALILKQQGLSESMISWLIAWGALAEATVFFTFSSFSHLLSLRSWIAISCAATVLRWLAMANAPGIELLFVLQTLHGLSYALGFVACVTFIAKRTSPDVAAQAQSTFTVMQLVAAIIVVTAFGGFLESYGTKAFYVSAVVALIGTLFALSAQRFTPPES